MRFRASIFLGIGIGLAAALVLIAHTATHRMAGPPMLPDYGGPVRSVVMQYAAGSTFVVPVFCDYLKWQGPDVTVYIACPGETDLAEITGLLGNSTGGCRIVPVFTGHTMTAWSRDRWVALADGAGKPVTLLSSRGELAQDVWPQREGDSHVGEDLARAFPAVFSARRSGLYFDGGDLLADGGNVFVTHAVLERNLQHTVATRDDLVAALSRELGCNSVLMEDAPDHHAGMYMMAAGPGAAGKRTMLVADPSLGKEAYAGGADNDALFADGPDFSDQTQARFDSVAAVAEKAGYRVVRIPVVPGHGKMYMTYVNVILDRRDGKPIVYMSCYAGQERMNAQAEGLWKSLGYEVRRVDCTTVWRRGGTLHCLVNVFGRDP